MRIPPPIAKRQPHRFEIHGDVRVDDYHWLRERTNHEVISYLKAENAYVDVQLGHAHDFQEELFKENWKGKIFE